MRGEIAILINGKATDNSLIEDRGVCPRILGEDQEKVE